MHIFLYGPSGSGKSTTGELLANAIGVPFIDLDAEIERSAGMLVSEIINHGEEGFRELESEALRACVFCSASVIALGGGTMLREENLSLARKSGQVVFLDAEFPDLVDRLARDETQRPLVAGNLEQSLQSLLGEREHHYGVFTTRVDASQSPEEVVWDIQRKIGRFHLSGMGQGYDVLVEEGGLDCLGVLLSERGLSDPIMVVSDSNVAPLYAKRVMESLQDARFYSREVVIPPGEAYKTLDTVSSLWRGFLDAGLDRSSTVVALGGGVVGDLAGFAAATFMRGCNWVAVPTTLLAMVDASLGGKTGFDLPEGKNLVGAFHPPKMVLADPEVLGTLPERELCSGMAEVVKHGVIADPELFDLCAKGWDMVSSKLPEIVRRGMAVKVQVIEQDPYEKGIRAALNFGHTVGHAVELVSGFNLLHGEAISIGMVSEAKLSESLSIAGGGSVDALADTLSGLNLPTIIPDELPSEALVKVMQSDKKKVKGIVRFALPVKVGAVTVGIEIENLYDALEVKV